jgi:hypothetical protein
MTGKFGSVAIQQWRRDSLRRGYLLETAINSGFFYCLTIWQLQVAHSFFFTAENLFFSDHVRKNRGQRFASEKSAGSCSDWYGACS